jgi:hypothetical protein
MRELSKSKFRQRLHNEARLKYVSISKFSKETGINKRTLGLIFKDQQTLSLDKLDVITEFLRYPPSYFYDDYINECFINGHVHYGRASEFIIHCYFSNRPDIAEKMKVLLIEDTSKRQVNQTFIDIAEQLFLIGMTDYSESYYDYIIQVEDSFSQKLAIAVLRKYFIVRTRNDTQQTRKYIYKLMDMVKILPEQATVEFYNDKTANIGYQFFGYFLILKYFNSREDWEQVYYYASQLKKISKGHPFYYPHSLIYLISSLREKGNIAKALIFNQEISKFGAKYERLSIGNKMLIEVERGNENVVGPVLEWIQTDDELKLFLPVMLECFIKNKNYNSAIEVSINFEYLFDENFHSVTLLHQRRKSRLLLALSELYFHFGFSSEASAYLAEAIELSLQSNNLIRFQKCMLLFTSNLHIIKDNELKLIQESIKKGES